MADKLITFDDGSRIIAETTTEGGLVKSVTLKNGETLESPFDAGGFADELV